MLRTPRSGHAVGAAAGLAMMVLTAQPVAASAGTYVVRPHDTLCGIAMAFGTTVQALVLANGLSDARYIVPGEVLRLPDRDAPEGTGRAWARCWPGACRWRHLTCGRERLAQAPLAPWPSAGPTGQPPSAPTPPMPVPAGPAGGLPATATPLPSMGAAGSIAALLTAQAQAADVDPALVKAVAWQESGWQMVTAADGGIGIMQLMPATVAWVETTLLGQRLDPYNPADNVRAGVAVLRYDLTVLGDERLAIAAYHQGLRSMQTAGVSAATARYVANVLALQQRFAV
jgi:LysM repeat protein